MNYYAQYPYDSLTKITKFLSILLYVGICFSLISVTLSIISNNTTMEDLKITFEPENSLKKTDQNIESKEFFRLYGGLYSLIYLLIAVIFLYWFFRSYKNLYPLNVQGLKFSPIKAVAFCIIPVINLWKPYFIMKEVLLSSKASSDRSSSKIVMSDIQLVKGWWIIFLSAIFFPIISTTIFSEYISNIVTNILLVLASILLLFLLKEITSRQEKRFNNMNLT